MTHKPFSWMKILLPVVVLALGAGGYAGIQANAKKPDPKKTIDRRPTVEIQTLEAEDYTVTITSHGELAPLEQTRLTAQVSGEIIHWHPDFVAGGLVKAGEILVEIAPEDYEAAVLQAEANLFSAQSALIEEKARAQVAEEEVRRVRDRKGTDLFLRKPQLLSAEAAVKSAQAALKRARRDLANCKVRAPYDALIASRDIGKGQFITAGATIAVLHNIQSGEIKIPIAGFDVPFLSADPTGITARLKVANQPDIQRDGVIVRDLGQVDPTTRMSYLVVRLDDPYSLGGTQPVIKFGSYLEVTFSGKTLPSVYPLPQEVVQRGTVWLISDNRRMTARHVSILREEGSRLLVREGLNNGEKLILTLPEYPQEGMEVKLAGEHNG